MAKNVLITGATSGIGLALIEPLKAAGYTPVLTGRNATKTANLAAQYDVNSYTLDVANPQAILDVTRQIKSDLGPLHALINNAGIWLEGDFDKYNSNDIKAVMDTNTMGTINMTHAVLPDMLAHGSGTVINVVSTGALYTRKSISVYSASKWAIRGFTGCLEAECAPKGVRVMGFYPGKIASNMYDTAGIERDLSVAMTPEKAAEMLVIMLADEGMVWGQVSGRALKDYV